MNFLLSLYLLLTQPIYYEARETTTSTYKEAFYAEITGYTAREEETDDTPNITASGERVRKGFIACPGRFAFGTRVVVEGTEYECMDRMARRYRDGDYFDIFFEDLDEARKFGRQQLLVQVKNEE